jgi:DNA-binding NarL/FixJ family response regulator
VLQNELELGCRYLEPIYTNPKLKKIIDLLPVLGYLWTGAAMSTKIRLSDIEIRIFQLIAEGFRMEEIALVMERSTSTIKNHLVPARSHLGAKTNAQAIAILDDNYPNWRISQYEV